MSKVVPRAEMVNGTLIILGYKIQHKISPYFRDFNMYNDVAYMFWKILDH